MSTGTSPENGTPSRQDAAEPITILIGALGGEGGGVLTDWLVSAAMAAGFPVQSTSIPGVAQRTGATTYYLEIFPVKRSELNGREPVLGLYPSPGRVDLAIASELLEAGRIIENGFVSPDRTTMIASTHRIYAIAEKSAMGDGRFDTSHLPGVARKMARQAFLFDLPLKARESHSVLNALLLGVIVGSGRLQLPPELFQQAIREKGVAVESNLRGLETGIALALEAKQAREGDQAQSAGVADDGHLTDAGAPEVDAEGTGLLPPSLAKRIEEEFPAAVRPMLRAGVLRLVDFQGHRYAERYLERLIPLLEVEASHDNGQGRYELTREAARQLAAWMSYEDAIRVADLKTRPARFRRIAAEAVAGAGEPLRITEFLDPGLDEISAILPPFLARPLLRLAERYPGLARFRRPMKVRTDTIAGFLKLWTMARLRWFRPFTFRYQEEQLLIERWLLGVRKAAVMDLAFGLEAALCAKLLKGYGDTYRRGRKNFETIFSALVENPAYAETGNGGHALAAGAAVRVREAREAALADEDCKTLDGVMQAQGEAGGR
ncbi:MAG: indolepyruvate oxidoreductase subunit beta family protein [bacterium]